MKIIGDWPVIDSQIFRSGYGCHATRNFEHGDAYTDFNLLYLAHVLALKRRNLWNGCCRLCTYVDCLCEMLGVLAMTVLVSKPKVM